MKGEKINLKKTFKFVWIGMVIVLIISMLATIKPYKKYKKGQSLAVASMLVATDKFDEYKDNKKELLKRMYDFFDTSSYPHNSLYLDVIESKHDAEKTLENTLKKAGYDEFYFASDYFKYTNFFEYYNYRNIGTGHFFVIYIIICSVILIINLLYILNGKKEILVKDNMIVFKKFPKKEKEFMIKDITSAETSFLKGLKIKGNSIKENILLLKNNEELKNNIMKLISNKSDSSNLSIADELAKYKKLLDTGAITKEEYKKKKEKLLDL